MSTIDIEWPRWIMSSMILHFNQELGTHAQVFITGIEFDPPENLDDFYELRLDGPHLREWSKGFWRVYVEVSILIQSSIDDNNLYKIHNSIGIAQKACLGGIPIYKLGDGPNDTGAELGCMKLIRPKNGRDQLEGNHFGPVGPRQRLQQASVEGHFEMLIYT